MDWKLRTSLEHGGVVSFAPAALDPTLHGQNPIGIVTGLGAFAFVANDVSRNVTVLATADDSQAVAGLGTDPRVAAATALPASDADAAALRGKRAWNTGLTRFTPNGQGAGACQVCHFEGLSDNVTWYFARGPRQATS